MSKLTFCDELAAHIAASWVDRGYRPEEIAARAYDLAEALVHERLFRAHAQDGVVPAWNEEEQSAEDEQSALLGAVAEAGEAFGGDPRWELEPRWRERDLGAAQERRAAQGAGAGAGAGPGLASTRPDDPAAQRRSG